MRMCDWCGLPIDNPTSAQKRHRGKCATEAAKYQRRTYMRQYLRAKRRPVREKSYRQIRARSRRLAVQWRKDNPALAAELDAARAARGITSVWSGR